MCMCLIQGRNLAESGERFYISSYSHGPQISCSLLQPREAPLALITRLYRVKKHHVKQNGSIALTICDSLVKFTNNFIFYFLVLAKRHWTNVQSSVYRNNGAKGGPVPHPAPKGPRCRDPQPPAMHGRSLSAEWAGVGYACCEDGDFVFHVVTCVLAAA